ncbi:MAG: succinate dehydrogenase cytochrome b subunit [Planctomycetaceae bacterium]
MDVFCKIFTLPCELLAKVPGLGPILKSCCTTVGQKILMALTGLSLCGFLVAHLGGNLYLFAGQEAFNGYAEKLHSLGPLLWVAEVGLLGLFALHMSLAMSTAAISLRARGRAYDAKQSKQEGFVLPNGGAANLMLGTGLIILVYLVLHVCDMKFNVREMGSEENLFELVRNVLCDPKTAAFYVVALLALGVHLTHGVKSAIQTLGISHPRWNKLFEIGGVLFAWGISLGFLSLVAWAIGAK